MDKYQDLREMLQNDCEHLRFRGDFVRALLAERDALLEALENIMKLSRDLNVLEVADCAIRNAKRQEGVGNE